MEHESIELLCRVNGIIVKSTLDLFERDDTDEIRIRMRGPVAVESVGKNFFESLVAMREVLEAHGVKLCCYGAAINFYPSPFILDTGEGRKVFRLVFGRQALSADLVDIFQYEEGLEIATVDEQQKWYAGWLNSLR